MSSPAGHNAAAKQAALQPLSDTAIYFVELIAGGLADHPASLEMWRDLVDRDLSFFTSPISEEIREEGRTQARAEDILLVLENRGVAVPDDVRARITGCQEREVMRPWLLSAVTARSAREIFGGV
ncbi:MULTISPECIES: hypothetical protein [Streptomyces]|uniref:hypothetical protein n=1 Tax=Streptomyces TaxID=1883 RepID=UPI00084C9DF8|nr:MULTISPECIES: hypothetical protein [Streptomyces]TFI24817.1 hypothetical protein E4P36_22215 [Streptomyces sp. 4R-3d]